MSDNPQGSLGNYPVGGPAPQLYIEPGDAMNLLTTRYPAFVPAQPLSVGDLLVASMALDEEGPFLGTKVAAEQDRSFPRTYKYGWPNLVSVPSPLLVSRSYSGAWLLDYEQVVPQQILDWVCLEAYRMVTLEPLKVVTQESVGGASVRYAPGVDYPHGQMSQLDRIQATLLGPFQARAGHVVPFLFWDGD